MKRPLSKHDQATDYVEGTLHDCALALSKLGGKVKYKSKEVPPTNTYIARQYLESVISRLRVVQILLTADRSDKLWDQIKATGALESRNVGPDASFPLEKARDLAKTTGTEWEKEFARQTIVTPQDDFEREYDLNHKEMEDGTSS